MKLPNKVYDVLKWVAQIVLPGIGALYFGLASIWGFPYAEQVVGSITVIDTFLGAILGISTMTYEGDGTLEIDTSDPVKDTYRLNVSTALETLPTKKTITLKVDPKVSLDVDAKK